MTTFVISDTVYGKLLEKYRPSSIKTFTLNLKRILRDGFDLHHFDVKPLTDFKKTKKYLETVDNMAMRKSLVSTILAFLRVNDKVPKSLVEEYEAHFKKLASKVNTSRLYKEPKDSELDNWLPWKDILKKQQKFKIYADCIDELPRKDITIEDQYVYMRYVLLSLYTQIPPLRGEEYLNAIVVSISNPKLYQTIRDMTGRNLFDLNHKKFTVYGYKTSGLYGIRTISIPDGIVDIVKKWTSITKSQLLLPSLQELPENEVSMSKEALAQTFFKIFEPKNISTSMLRKIYISHTLKTLKDPEKRKELALTMGHSLQTQEFIYNRFK